MYLYLALQMSLVYLKDSMNYLINKTVNQIKFSDHLLVNEQYELINE